MISYATTVAEQSFLLAPLVFGGYLTIALMKLPDLSLEASFLAGAIAASKVMSFYGEITTIASAFVIICASLFSGMIIGSLSFLLTRIAKLPHLLSSLIIIGLMHGASQCILQTSLLPLASHQTILNIFPNYPEYIVSMALRQILHQFLPELFFQQPTFQQPILYLD